VSRLTQAEEIDDDADPTDEFSLGVSWSALEFDLRCGFANDSQTIQPPSVPSHNLSSNLRSRLSYMAGKTTRVFLASTSANLRFSVSGVCSLSVHGQGRLLDQWARTHDPRFQQ